MCSHSFPIGPAIVPTNHSAVNKDRPLTFYILLYIELNGRVARFISEDDNLLTQPLMDVNTIYEML